MPRPQSPTQVAMDSPRAAPGRWRGEPAGRGAAPDTGRRCPRPRFRRLLRSEPGVRRRRRRAAAAGNASRTAWGRSRTPPAPAPRRSRPRTTAGLPGRGWKVRPRSPLPPSRLLQRPPSCPAPVPQETRPRRGPRAPSSTPLCGSSGSALASGWPDTPRCPRPGTAAPSEPGRCCQTTSLGCPRSRAPGSRNLSQRPWTPLLPLSLSSLPLFRKPGPGILRWQSFVAFDVSCPSRIWRTSWNRRATAVRRAAAGPKSPLEVPKTGCVWPWEPQMGEGSGIQLGPLLQRRPGPPGAPRASGM